MTLHSPDGKWIWNGENWIPALSEPGLEQNQNLPPIPQNPTTTLNPILPPAPPIPELAQNPIIPPMPPIPVRHHNQVSTGNPQIKHVEEITSNFNSEVHGNGNSAMSDSVVTGDVSRPISNHIIVENELNELSSESKKLEDWRFAVIAYDNDGAKAEVIEEIRNPTADELFSLTEKWVRKISNVKSYSLSEIKIFIIPSRELFGLEILANYGIKSFEQTAGVDQPAGMTVDRFWNCKVIEHNLLVALGMLPRLEIVYLPDPDVRTFGITVQLYHYMGSNEIFTTEHSPTPDEILKVTKWLIDGDVQSLSSYEWMEL
jgi:hypothetical protein